MIHRGNPLTAYNAGIAVVKIPPRCPLGVVGS